MQVKKAPRAPRDRRAPPPSRVAPPCLVGPSGVHRCTSSSYISLRTPKTSREPTKHNFHRRNLLYPRDLSELGRRSVGRKFPRTPQCSNLEGFAGTRDPTVFPSVFENQDNLDHKPTIHRISTNTPQKEFTSNRSPQERGRTLY